MGNSCTREFDQGRRYVEAMNDAAGGGTAKDLKGGSAAAAGDVGDATGCVEIEGADERFIHGGEGGFQAGGVGAPFFAASGGPVGACRGSVHNRLKKDEVHSRN